MDCCFFFVRRLIGTLFLMFMFAFEHFYAFKSSKIKSVINPRSNWFFVFCLLLHTMNKKQQTHRETVSPFRWTCRADCCNAIHRVGSFFISPINVLFFYKRLINVIIMVLECEHRDCRWKSGHLWWLEGFSQLFLCSLPLSFSGRLWVLLSANS